MKGKWGGGINYIDLFAGPGLGRIAGTFRIVKGSPLLALDTEVPFDLHVFCDNEPRCISALKKRVLLAHPMAAVTYVEGDSNDSLQEIVSCIPKPTQNSKPLSFCFVDPFSLRLQFRTFERLSEHCGKIDFLVLLALGMDAGRNEGIYVDGTSSIVDDLLDDPTWRERWRKAQRAGTPFGRFVSESFSKRMFHLGYKRPADWGTMEFRSDEKNLPLYHLAFFSKDPLGYKFWNECRKYSRPQQSLGI